MRTRSKFSRSVMVSFLAVSSLGHTDLFFIDQGTKVNGQLLPAIRDLSGDFFTFHEVWCTPEFIAPALRPANSPDINLVDYQTWGKYRSWMHDVDQLKSPLIEDWKHFHQVFIDEAIRQWCPRLRVCIRAHGGHFEHRL